MAEGARPNDTGDARALLLELASVIESVVAELGDGETAQGPGGAILRARREIARLDRRLSELSEST